MFALTLDGKFIYRVSVTSIKLIFFFMVPIHTENHQLFRTPLELQHQIGTAETSSLKDSTATELLTFPL